MTLPTPDSIISLLTDFGTRDHYVAVMKAVVLRICPNARVIDLTHEVEPFQIRQAAYLLAQSWKWFPRGSVHVAVVDPGVGSERRAIAARADGHYFVLPDNGLLALIGVEEPQVREMRNQALTLAPISRTFHGRDIFAPSAAHLASGFPFEEVGPPIEDWVQLPKADSAVLHIDRFGNVVTSVRADEYAEYTLSIGATNICRRGATYSDAPTGELFLIEGSGGYLEISEREASAAARLGCRVGDRITVIPSDKN